MPKKIFDLPESWRFAEIEAMRNGKQFAGFRITGGIPKVKTRGPDKGSHSWRGVPCETFYISVEREEQLRRKYEAETGLCFECEGSGHEVESISIHHPTTYRNCRKCKGTGKAQPTESQPESTGPETLR